MSEAIKVVEVIEGLSGGGAEESVLRRLLRVPVDFQVHVLVSRPPEGLVLPSNVELVIGQTRSRRWLRETLFNLRPDVIVLHTPLSVVAVSSLRKSYLGSAQIVSFCHSTLLSDSRFRDALLRLPIRLANSKVALCFAVSGLAANGAWSKGCERTVVVNLGSDLPLSKGARAEPRNPVFLMAGRFSPIKRFPGAIRALRKLDQDEGPLNIHLVVVGSGKQESAIRREAAKCRFTTEVLGWSTNLADTYEKVDAVLVSSRAEGGPLVLYEALLSGARFVSTEVGVAPELSKIDPESLVSEGTSLREWAIQVKSLARLGSISESQREIRRERFSALTYENSTSRFYELLRTLIPNPGCR